MNYSLVRANKNEPRYCHLAHAAVTRAPLRTYCFSHDQRGNVECKLSGKPEIFGLRTMQTPVSYIDIGLQVSSTAGDNKGLSDISNVSKNKVMTKCFMMKEVIV